MQEEVCGILVDVKEYREHDALLKVLCEDRLLLSLSAVEFVRSQVRMLLPYSCLHWHVCS